MRKEDPVNREKWNSNKPMSGYYPKYRKSASAPPSVEPDPHYKKYGYVGTFEVRPPKCGEWFVGPSGMARQAGCDYTSPKHILIKPIQM